MIVMKFSLVLLGLCSIFFVYSAKELFFKNVKYSSRYLVMSTAVVRIIKGVNMDGVAIATIISDIAESTYEHDDTIYNIVNELENSIALKIFDIETASKTEDHLKDTKKIIIVLIENFANFKHIPEFYDRKILDFRGLLIIAFMNNSESRYHDAHLMLVDLWKVRILNANILVYGKNEHEIDVLTGYPYESNKCGTIVMKSIKKIKGISDTSFGYNEINANKLSNMNGCLLKVDHGTVADSFGRGTPFIFNDTETNEFDGIDIRILKRKLVYYDRSVFEILFLQNNYFSNW